jgi:hypothetical protein
LSGQITWLDGADILRWSPRTLRRWRRRCERNGYDGLFDRRRRLTVPGSRCGNSQLATRDYWVAPKDTDGDLGDIGDLLQAVPHRDVL